MFGMMRAVLLCLLFLVVPASASAATLVKSGSTLTYTAAAGRTNQPNFDSPVPTTTRSRPRAARRSRAGTHARASSGS